MKITINENNETEEVEIIVNCKKINSEILKVISMLKSCDEKLKGHKDGKIVLLECGNIFYFESVDKKTFVYMYKEVYECDYKLYELESKFVNTDFFRASKSTIINIEKIREIVPMFGGRLQINLENNEKLVVSRQYVPVLKKKLDL